MTRISIQVSDDVNIGLVGVICDVMMMIGTNNVEEKILKSRGYSIEPRHPHLACRKYQDGEEIWSVTYKRLSVHSSFNLSSLYREGR